MYLEGVRLSSLLILSIFSSFIQDRNFSQKTMRQLEPHREMVAIEERLPVLEVM